MMLFTIGFTKKSAECFFSLLKDAGVQKLIDVRLNNVSQLAGFAKKVDLAYFTKSLCGIDYTHLPFLAPTKPMLDAYKRQKGAWSLYERQFIELITERKIEHMLERDAMVGACLLCSEVRPHLCHRRLVAEYLQQRWGDLQIKHIE